MQIIKYEVEDNILTVGFKVDSFVVYSNIPYDNSKSKDKLLQLAYTNVKDTIDYEKGRDEHSITTDKVGEEFTPEPSKAKSISIELDKYIVNQDKSNSNNILHYDVIIKDQYNSILNVEPVITISTGEVVGNKIALPKVDANIEVTIAAKYNELADSKIIKLIPYKEDEVKENPLLNALDRVNKVDEKSEGILLELEEIKNNNSDIEINMGRISGSNSSLYNEIETIETYLLDYEFRVSLIELGL